MPDSDLPFVRINVATTADGKIAPANRHFIPFSSKRDQTLLLKLRTEADAVLCGARTVDTGEVDLGPGGKKYQKLRLSQGRSEYNLRVIASGSASLDPKAHIFTQRFSPIIVLTCGKAPPEKVQALKEVADAVESFGETEIDFAAALRWLKSQWKVEHLLCEGGGEINAALFEQNLVNELYLTLCPVILGGRDAPTLADGKGFAELSKAARLEMKSMKRWGDELFLVYNVPAASAGQT